MEDTPKRRGGRRNGQGDQLPLKKQVSIHCGASWLNRNLTNLSFRVAQPPNHPILLAKRGWAPHNRMLLESHTTIRLKCCMLKALWLL